MSDVFSEAHARELDKQDTLKHFRERFRLDDPNLIYLDGNSLGVLPKDTSARLSHVVNHEWGNRLIRSWNEGWYERASKISAKIALLTGAREDEIILADSTSVNLYKLVWAALNLQKGRTGIITDELNFPSDIYLLQGLTTLGKDKHSLNIANYSDSIQPDLSEFENLISESTALVTLSHVVFKSAYLYDMKLVNQMAHKSGALVIWDLSHSVGAVPVRLNETGADMAVGCTYKYLNGGPGSPAFLYIRKDLQEKLLSPIWGWFGEENPFEFGLHYRPAKGIRQFLAGTPPILSLSAIEPSIDIMLEAGMENIRLKSIAQSEYLISLFKKYLSPVGFNLGSPENPDCRGSHISLQHPEAYRICQALIDPQTEGKIVIPDFREPDNIRLGITPLYTRFLDVYESVIQMKNIVEKQLYLNFKADRAGVT